MALQLRIDNPFTIGVITDFNDGELSLDRRQLAYVPSENDKVHVLRDWDNLCDLAHDYYGNSKLYWVLQDINDMENFWEFGDKKTIIIPDFKRIRALL